MYMYIYIYIYIQICDRASDWWYVSSQEENERSEMRWRNFQATKIQVPLPDSAHDAKGEDLEGRHAAGLPQTLGTCGLMWFNRDDNGLRMG